MRSKYKKLKILSEPKFRRLSGVYPETFKKMMKILRAEKRNVRSRGGPKDKLSLPNQLLLCLEYLREYRTFFHIGSSYSVSESTAWRIQKWVEETLIQSGEFTLPGKKVLHESNSELELVLVDVSECPIERPKKKKSEESQKPSKVLLLWKKEKAQHEIASSCR